MIAVEAIGKTYGNGEHALNALIDAPGIDAALMIEDRQQVILLETSDHREAVAAFRERRDPSYSDR